MHAISATYSQTATPRAASHQHRGLSDRPGRAQRGERGRGRKRCGGLEEEPAQTRSRLGRRRAASPAIGLSNVPNGDTTPCSHHPRLWSPEWAWCDGDLDPEPPSSSSSSPPQHRPACPSLESFPLGAEEGLEHGSKTLNQTQRPKGCAVQQAGSQQAPPDKQSISLGSPPPRGSTGRAR